jgi:hypothetical protein
MAVFRSRTRLNGAECPSPLRSLIFENSKGFLIARRMHDAKMRVA